MFPNQQAATATALERANRDATEKKAEDDQIAKEAAKNDRLEKEAAEKKGWKKVVVDWLSRR